MALVTEIAGSQDGLALDLFATPEQQLESVRTWSLLLSWGFTAADFEQAKRQLATITWPSRHLNTLVLVPNLDTVGRTFEQLWLVAGARQLNSWHAGNLKSDEKHLRLRPGITHRPGLRWEVIKLGANPNVAPADVPTALAAHAGVLAAAAHFPKWLQAMNGDDVPFVWLAGYQCVDGIRPPWRSAPYFLSEPEAIYLSTGADDDDGGGCFAVPVRWEC